MPAKQARGHGWTSGSVWKPGQWEGAQPVLQGGELPGRHQPGARRQTPTTSSRVPAMLVKRRCNSQTQPQGSAVRPQLLQGFKRGFQAWENPSFWMTLENSGLLANLPFLSVYDSISGNTHSFDFFHNGLGGEGRDEVKRKSNASKGRPPCLSKSIFTSTDQVHPSLVKYPRHSYSVKSCVVIQNSSDEKVEEAALNSSYSICVKQEKSGLPVCACPVITTL